MTTAYPLAWPEGWPRTSYHMRKSDHPFGGKVYGLTFERARQQLTEELHRLGATGVALSTNVPLRQDGYPYAGAALKRMDDPGVAVYFTLNKRQLVMAQDRYTDVAANLRSLALAIEGMRQLKRHGGGTMMERAFTGFAALPAPTAPKQWWESLGVDRNCTVADAERAYRALAKEHHPDTGGNVSRWHEINDAIEHVRKVASR